MLAGDSSSGKSTLLASLLARGWTMLADDLTAVTVDQGAGPAVPPMFGEIALWPDALEALDMVGRLNGPRSEGASEVGQRSLGRQTIVTEDRLAAEAQPLREIWLLRTHNEREIEF